MCRNAQAPLGAGDEALVLAAVDCGEAADYGIVTAELCVGVACALSP